MATVMVVLLFTYFWPATPQKLCLLLGFKGCGISRATTNQLNWRQGSARLRSDSQGAPSRRHPMSVLACVSLPMISGQTVSRDSEETTSMAASQPFHSIQISCRPGVNAPWPQPYQTQIEFFSENPKKCSSNWKLQNPRHLFAEEDIFLSRRSKSTRFLTCDPSPIVRHFLFKSIECEFSVLG